MSTVLTICCLVVVAILRGINGLPEQQVGIEDHSEMMEFRSPISCNCEFRNLGMVDDSLVQGCIITKSAPPGSACHCTESMPIYPPRCWGTIVECKNEESPYCQNPDTSYMSCEQGQGNCDGYPIWPEPENVCLQPTGSKGYCYVMFEGYQFDTETNSCFATTIYCMPKSQNFFYTYEECTKTCGAIKPAMFTGPTKKIWSDTNCPVIESHVSKSLSECKALCVNTAGCTAINFSADPPGTGQGIDSCILRACKKPGMEPPSDYPPYYGYSYITGTFPKCGGKGCETGVCTLREGIGCPNGKEARLCRCTLGISPVICCSE